MMHLEEEGKNFAKVLPKGLDARNSESQLNGRKEFESDFLKEQLWKETEWEVVRETS